MDYLSLISSVTSGAKGAVDLARGLQSLTVDTEVKLKTNELLTVTTQLYTQLLEAKISMAELHHEHEQLKQKLADNDRWNEEVVKSYRLQEICSGVFVYAYQGPSLVLEGTEVPNHYLCTRCFELRRKSILQNSGYNNRGLLLKCHECGAEICNHAVPPASAIGVVAIKSRRSKFDEF